MQGGTSRSKKEASGFSAVLTVESTRARNVNLHVVTEMWIKGDILYYPPVTSQDAIEVMIKGRTEPDVKTWKKYAFIRKKNFSQYPAAKKYVTQRDEVQSESDDQSLKTLLVLQRNIFAPSIFDDSILITNTQ